MVRRFFVPLRTSARIRFSGIPHKPNPPIMIVAPSNTSRIASSALATTLFIESQAQAFTNTLTLAYSQSLILSQLRLARVKSPKSFSAQQERTRDMQDVQRPHAGCSGLPEGDSLR